MGKFKYCIECGQALYNEEFLKDIEEGILERRQTKLPVGYCVNKDCSRFGLLTMCGYNREPNEEKTNDDEN